MRNGELRCGICGSSRLSPVAQLRTVEGQNDRLRLKFPRPRAFTLRPTFNVDAARACLDCGAVLPFLGEDALNDLNESADGLTGYDA
ncbi:hypothetical protein SSOG_03611 [Streptomyces himastatinicus ATCC 53653]|uniref:Uncharacterized protein n=1 Tax=Streptomyces himastatinicus ATCC 53653 TaxID=457427 RepID=D9WPP3_9ACTN|nr:hypothetical protein [Streptomyces himastatinicus]EFL23897.1 hypothetical protein SSOG_03611 [Streptomyces himastatinicus ATCC 53653]